MGMKLPPDITAKVLEVTSGGRVNPGKAPEQPARKRSKYNAKKTTVDGIAFDSKKEASQYSVLTLLQRAGQISGLKLQVRYRLIVNDVLVCVYVADFVYYDINGSQVVEDCKGFKTREYELKKKLMLAVYGIKIKEV